MRIIRITKTGTGSKRITIPKDLLEDVFENDDYAEIKKVANGLLLQRVKITEER